MTIDEAIEFCNEKSKNIKLRTEPKTFEQLAELLEELKVYQQHEIICNKGYNAGYNKAIDDFVNIAKEHYFKYVKKDITNCVIGFIEFFAEQLKEGRK